MNPYDQELTDLIARIKADKSLVQPWRNKAAARVEEAHAFVRMGKITTFPSTLNLPADGYVPPSYTTQTSGTLNCICQPGMRLRSCQALIHAA